VAQANNCCQVPPQPDPRLSTWWESAVLTPVRSATAAIFTPTGSSPPPGYDPEEGGGGVAVDEPQHVPQATPSNAALPPRPPRRAAQREAARTLDFPPQESQPVQRRLSNRSDRPKPAQAEVLDGSQGAEAPTSNGRATATASSPGGGRVASLRAKLEPATSQSETGTQRSGPGGDLESALEAPAAQQMGKRKSTTKWSHQAQLKASLMAWNRRFDGVRASEAVSAEQLKKVARGDTKKGVPPGFALAMGAVQLAMRLKELQAIENPSKAERAELLTLLKRDADLKNNIFVFMSVVKVAILAYAGMMGCMLIVFVPQTCGVGTPGQDAPPGESRHACLFLENVWQFGPYTKFCFILNLVTLFVFLSAIVVQFQRERWLHEHLDHNQDLPARALPVLMSERPFLRRRLLVTNHRAKIMSYLALVLFVVNFIFSAVLLLGYTNQGVRTLSSLVNNAILIFIRMVVQASITSQSAGNGWAITLFSTTAVNMNDIDPNFVTNYDDEVPEPPDSELVKRLRRMGLMPERSDKVYELDDAEMKDPACLWCPI
jgi:hypothetical protein